MDVDDVQVAVLEETIKTSSNLSFDISNELKKLARLNKKAIDLSYPLVHSIQRYQLSQKNLNSIQNKISGVKPYAGRIREQINSMRGCSGLNGLNDIKLYLKSLNELANISNELSGVGFGNFEGLNKSLHDGLLEGEATLTRGLISKIDEIGELQIHGRPNTEINAVYEQSKLIYKYLMETRNMNLEDDIINERMKFMGEELQTVQLEKRVVNGDQNYIYDGTNTSVSFPDFTKRIKLIIGLEISFAKNLFEGLTISVAKIAGKLILPIIETYVNELESSINFIERNKRGYNTLYYEVAVGSRILFNWMDEYKLKPIDQLEKLVLKCETGAKNTFSEFFNYIRTSFNNSNINAHEKLDSTFLMICTRMNKLTTFKSYQLDFIYTMQFNSWLPQVLPDGFFMEKKQSTDRQYMLGSFYTDLIEYSFYLLMERFRSTKSNEEDVGVALLANLDGLQNFLEGKSNLKQIIGQRGVERYEKLKKKAMDKAVSSWSTLTSRLMIASTMQGDNLSMNNKDLIRFIDDFNARIDSQYNDMKTKDIPQYFRSQMISDITKTLIPTYKIFYNNASGSKSIEKHFVYTPQELTRKLASL